MRIFTTPPRSASEVATRGPETIPDPRLKDLAAYWFAKSMPGTVPRRADIDPLDFRSLLPNIMMLDRILASEGARFRFRLAGTRVVDMAGRELTGRFLDEVLPDTYSAYVHGLNGLALQHRLPVYSSSLYHDEGNFINALTYRLILPLSTAGEEPDLIFACQFWQRRADAGHWSGDWQSVAPEILLIARP